MKAVMVVQSNGVAFYVREGLGILEFNKFPNSISMQTSEFLCQWTQEIETWIQHYKITAVVLLSTEAKVFVSGGDLTELASMSELQGTEFTKNMRRFTACLGALAVPTYTLVNAMAAGGGAEIALATDFRCAIGTDTCLWLAQTRWGVPGGWGGMSRLQKLVPQYSARKVGILFAQQKKFQLPELVTLGIVDHVFENHELCFDDLRKKSSSNLTHRCPRNLEIDLLRRPENDVATDSKFTTQELYDMELFEKHWLSKEHRQRLSNCEYVAKGGR